MKKYRVVNRPLFLKQGVLSLTKAQYDLRKHALKKKGKASGRYEVVGEVCFKIGEEIGYDGAVSKGQTNLEPVGNATGSD